MLLNVEWKQQFVVTLQSYISQGGLTENEENLAPLTAFTLISLLEMYTEDVNKTSERKKAQSLVNKLLKNTLPCLEHDETDEMADVYTRALTAYALALAGQSDNSRQHIDWLMTHAQSNNSLLWWQKPGALKPFKFITHKSKTNFFKKCSE